MLDKQDMIDLAESKGWKFLSESYTEYDTKYRWECDKGHEIITQHFNIKGANKCKHCNAVKREEQKELYKQEKYIELKKFFEERNATLLSTEFITNSSRYNGKCHICGREFSIQYISSVNNGTWCDCANRFMSERIVRNIFQTLFNTTFEKVRLKEFKGLELDGYNAELKLAFEYNGEQHYNPNCFVTADYDREEKFKEQVKRDKLKKELCVTHGITLVVIPYTFMEPLNQKKLKREIKKQLTLQHYTVPSNFDEIKLTKSIQQVYKTGYNAEQFQKVKILSESRNEVCISEYYINADRKLKFRCKHNHEFKASPTYYRLYGCPECNRQRKYQKKKESLHNFHYNSGVYVLTSPSGLQYVGYSKDITKIFGVFSLYTDKMESSKLKNELLKYKFENFKKELLINTDDSEIMKKECSRLIVHLDTRTHGLNSEYKKSDKVVIPDFKYNSGVYVCTSPSGLKYVSYSLDIRKAFKRLSIKPSKISNEKLRNELIKYNFKTFKHGLLLVSDDIDTLRKVTDYYIEIFKSSINGLNGLRYKDMTEEMKKEHYEKTIKKKAGSFIVGVNIFNKSIIEFYNWSHINECGHKLHEVKKCIEKGICSSRGYIFIKLDDRKFNTEEILKQAEETIKRLV